MADDQQNDTNATNQAPQTATPIPEGFPYREELAENEIVTIEALRALNDEKLLGLKKIGTAKAKTISEALAALLAVSANLTPHPQAREALKQSFKTERELYQERMKREDEARIAEHESRNQ